MGEDETVKIPGFCSCAARWLTNFAPVWLVLLLALPVLLSLRQFWGGSAARDTLFAPSKSLMATAFPSTSKDAAKAVKPVPPPPAGWNSFFQERKTLVRLRVAVGFVGVASLIAIFVAGVAMVKNKQPWLLIVAVALGGVVGVLRNSIDGEGRPSKDGRAAKASTREGVPDEIIFKIFEARCRLADPWNPSTIPSEKKYNRAIRAKAHSLAAWLRQVVQDSMLTAMVGLAFALLGFSSLLTNLHGQNIAPADVRQRLDRMREIMFAASLLLVSGVACTSCMHEYLLFSIQHVEGVNAYAETLNLRTGAQYTALLALAYWTTLLPLQKRAAELGADQVPASAGDNAAPGATSPTPIADSWKTMLPRLLAILAPLLTEPLIQVLDFGFRNIQ